MGHHQLDHGAAYLGPGDSGNGLPTCVRVVEAGEGEYGDWHQHGKIGTGGAGTEAAGCAGGRGKEDISA